MKMTRVQSNVLSAVGGGILGFLVATLLNNAFLFILLAAALGLAWAFVVHLLDKRRKEQQVW